MGTKHTLIRVSITPYFIQKEIKAFALDFKHDVKHIEQNA